MAGWPGKAGFRYLGLCSGSATILGATTKVRSKGLDDQRHSTKLCDKPRKRQRAFSATSNPILPTFKSRRATPAALFARAKLPLSSPSQRFFDLAAETTAHHVAVWPVQGLRLRWTVRSISASSADSGDAASEHSVWPDYGGGPQGGVLGNLMQQQPQQVQQMPVLAQSAAQLSSSLWQPGKETPRMFHAAFAVLQSIC